jgi:hypothetical protein
MALYLAEGGDSNRLLGLSCRHVLFASREVNSDYVRHPGGRSRKVLLLGNKAFRNLVDSIKLRIGRHGLTVEHWTQGMLDKAERAIEALRMLLYRVNKYWRKPDNRVLGRILYSPAINLGVGEHSFTEDWAIFQVNQAKFGDGFQGNQMDLGAF